MNHPYVFLAVIFLIGFLAKNNSLMLAIGVLFLITLLPDHSKVMSYVHSKGINIGVTIITIAVLVPIATGDIGITQLKDSLRSLPAWIALVSGVLVALLAKGGVQLLSSSPEITAALVLGTVLAVSLFKGVAVGPLIGAGIAYVFIQLTGLIK